MVRKKGEAKIKRMRIKFKKETRKTERNRNSLKKTTINKQI